ncbi:MAG: phage terminase large subunit [Elusimicrobia bacterium]|nr:phage terminase large subunit [Elusimicrobiota bacterium]
MAAPDWQERRARQGWITQCRTDLSSWCIEALKYQGFKPAAHHRLLISKLERVATGKCRRLIVMMPPGSAKSSYCSQLFPAWMLQRKRRHRIIGASHTTDLALDFSDKVQALITDNEEVLSYGLRTEQKQRWYTTNGGAYLAAGVGSAIPGFRADLGIIDDPVKSRMAADSDTDRKRVWDWYIGSFERRLTPGAPVILILTRWHEDDLAGRLIETRPDEWEILRIPAEAEEDDPLGRQPGEWLWSDDDYGYGAELADIKRTLEASGATREWASQYQQRPRPADGAIFRTNMISVLEAAPVGESVRAYDFAATEAIGSRDPDWTRGVRLTKTDIGRYAVTDVVGCRGGPDEVERLVVSTAYSDGKRVRIGIPQDPGQAGKVQVLYLTRKLAGYNVESSPETGDKATRAAPVASQVNVGNLDVVRGSWNKSFLDELAAFPAGAKKDQVDALSRAFSMLVESGSPFVLPPEVLAKVRSSGRDRFSTPNMRVRNRFARV